MGIVKYVFLIVIIIFIIGLRNYIIGCIDERPEIMKANSFIFIIPFLLIFLFTYTCQNQKQNDYEECLKLQEKIFIQEEVVSDAKLMMDLEKSNKKIEDFEKEYAKEKRKLNKYIKEYNKEANKYNSKHNGIFSKKITIYHNKN